MSGSRSSTSTGRSTRLKVVLGIAGILLALNARAAVADPGNGKANGLGNGNNGNRAAHAQSGDHQSAGTSATAGDPTQPQPPSNADDNGTGANTTGPYDSTRDGSPSENGSGDGNATGKPCAGCVGKADNKNPPGQLPGPQDANNGYECDGNHGVGKTNPAHTGCGPSTSTEPPEGSNRTPEVGGKVVLPSAAAPAATALPRTGSDIVSPLSFAAALLISGTMLLMTGRPLGRRQA